MPSPWNVSDAKAFGTILGIDWDEVEFSPQDLLKGMLVELEHGTELGEGTNVTNNDPLPTAQIAWAHLIESPLYYEPEGLPEMERRLEEKEAGTIMGYRRRFARPRRKTALDRFVAEAQKSFCAEIGELESMKQLQNLARQWAVDSVDYLPQRELMDIVSKVPRAELSDFLAGSVKSGTLKDALKLALVDYLTDYIVVYNTDGC